MSNRFIRKIAEAIRSLARSLAAHPVETAITLHACIVICVLETLSYRMTEIAQWMYPAILCPVFFVTAYCLNTLLARGAARAVYYLWWIDRKSVV